MQNQTQKNNNKLPLPLMMRPWSIASTAFILFVLLLLGGCKKPTPLRTGWVRLAALTYMHPNNEMLVDLDNRLLSLLEQRKALSRNLSVSIPPQDIEFTTPSLDALEAPAPTTKLDMHIDQLHEQELMAYRRILERDRDKKYKDAQIAFRTQVDEALIQQQQQLVQKTEQRRTQLLQEMAFSLLNAKLSLEAAQRYAAAQPAAGADRLARAQSTYDELNARYNVSLQVIDDDLARNMRQAEEKAEKEILVKLRTKDQQLVKDNQERYAQKAATLSADAPVPEVVGVPKMMFTAQPAGKVSLSVADLAEVIAKAIIVDRQQKRSDVLAIDRTIAKMLAQRKQLQTDISTETMEVAQAVAAQHGYQIDAAHRAGTEITDPVRSWLAEYWNVE